MPRLEVRLPISPTPPFLNRVRLVAAAVRRREPDTMVTVSCYPPPAPSSWFGQRGDIWQSPSASEFNSWRGTRSEFLATMMDRYKPPFHGDYVLMLDADVFPLGDFSELFAFDGIQGVQAHHSPYGVAGWSRLFRDFGLPAPEMRHEYSAWGVMEQRELERFGPFYPNSGVICGPRWVFEKLADPFSQAINFLCGMVNDTYWFDQVGFALGAALAAIPHRTLPIRWNFPNRPAFDAAFPGELGDIRFLHAMQTDIVHRDRDFEDIAAIRRLVARRDLTGSNEVLRSAMAELMPLAFPDPAPLACAEDAPWA